MAARLRDGRQAPPPPHPGVRALDVRILPATQTRQQDTGTVDSTIIAALSRWEGPQPQRDSNSGAKESLP